MFAAFDLHMNILISFQNNMQPKRVEYVSCLVCGLIGVLIGCLGLIPLVVLYTQRECMNSKHSLL